MELDLEKRREVNQNPEKVEGMDHQLTLMFDAQSISEEEVNGFYSNTEEELCYADSRSQILSLMLRERYAIGRLKRK